MDQLVNVILTIDKVHTTLKRTLNSRKGVRTFTNIEFSVIFVFDVNTKNRKG